MAGNQQAGSQYKVAILDQDAVKSLIYGLAYVKTLVNKSKVSADGYSLAGQVTNVSYGDNYDPLTFKRWVREENTQLLKSFQQACKAGVSQGWRWLDGVITARNSYFRNYQTVLDETNKINADLADAYLAGARTAAVVQYAAETALVGCSLFGGAASMTVNLALKKFVVGVGSSIAINVVEEWGKCADADLLLMTKDKSLENAPGTIDEVFSNILSALNGLAISNLKNRLAALEQEIARNVAYKNKLPIPSRAFMQSFLKSLYDEKKLLQKQIKNPGIGSGVVSKGIGRGFGILNWGLAIKSEIDNTNKLIKHWNGEL